MISQDALEERFIDLVNKSWDRYEVFKKASFYDDALVGGIITAHLRHGLYLLDCTSDSSAHYVMFSDPDRVRYIVRLEGRAGEDILYARTLGNLATMQVGISRTYPNLQKIWQATKTELKSDLAGQGNLPEPGVMQIDAQGTFATCQTSLFIDTCDYVDRETLQCDLDKLWTHLSACYQSLDKFLEGVMK